MHWRRFAISQIPLDDTKAFEDWLLRRWIEKDQLVEHYLRNGKFPGFPPESKQTEAGARRGQWVETEVKNSHPLEFLLAFAPTMLLVLVGLLVRTLWRAIF